MKGRSWTDKEVKYLKEHYSNTDTGLIAKKLNRSYVAVKTKAYKYNLSKDSYHFWTDEDLDILKELYPVNSTDFVARKLNLKPYQVYQKANKLGLKKSNELIKKQLDEQGKKLRKLGAKYRFPKGHIPENKGKKQTEFMSPEAIERTKKTGFKKGHIPKNHQPVGTERFGKDNYILIKIKEPSVWDLKHRVLWQKHYGEIPEGSVIVFKDGNINNISIENLEMLTREELMKKNTIQRYPEDLRKVMMLQGRLRKKIKEVQNEQ